MPYAGRERLSNAGLEMADISVTGEENAFRISFGDALLVIEKKNLLLSHF